MKLRQIKGRIWLGRAKVVFSRIGAYMSYVNFTGIILTFYTVKGYEYAPLSVFIILAIVGMIVIAGFDYLIMLPCETAFGNEQAAKHQNPIYEEVKAIRRELKELKERIEDEKN